MSDGEYEVEDDEDEEDEIEDEELVEVDTSTEGNSHIYFTVLCISSLDRWASRFVKTDSFIFSNSVLWVVNVRAFANVLPG